MIIRSLLLSLCILFAASTSHAYSDEIEWLRNQSFNKCKKYYVWRVVENYLQNTRWESGTKDGFYIVNVYGKMAYDNKNVNAMLQFIIDPKNRKFSTNALTFNGQPQSKVMIEALVESMCEDLG